MLAQARETSFQKIELLFHEEDGGFDHCLELGQEAADVGLVYDALIQTARVAKYQVPYSWMCRVQLKQRHYMALADYYVATALLGVENEVGVKEIKKLDALYWEDAGFVNFQSTVEVMHHLGNVIICFESCLCLLSQGRLTYEKLC
jgi:hypothetical protein